MKIINTLTKQKEDFTPVEPGKVRFYQCGPTVYWDQQIGNLRAYALADFINRSLRYLDYEVKFVRNYTDVGHMSGDNEGDADTGEDRMEKAAKRDSKTPEEVADFYIKRYETDINKLNILTPDETPKATEFIKQQQEMVSELLDKGFAYSTPLAIYFDTTRADNYTRLSGQLMSFNKGGMGLGEVSDSEKKSHADFSLWFFKAGTHKNALQTWGSPFTSELVENGEGFPGWHIECSAMGKALLGDTIDIKMGGIEHIPIHHTNEIAQSECCNAKEYVKYWVHNEHLLADGNKMGKSAGNAYLLSDLEDKNFKPLDLRYFFLQSHYRSKQNFTWDALKASSTSLFKLKSKIALMKDGGEINPEFKEKFIEKISDDFNIPEALAVVHEVLKSDLGNKDKKATILDFDSVLGLKLDDKSHLVIEEVVMTPELESLLEKRLEARNNKDWETSDAIRDQLEELGFKVKDGNKGQELSSLK